MKKSFKYFLVFLAGIMLLGVLVSVGTIKIPTVDTGTEETPTTPDVTYFPINIDFENVSLFSFTALKISTESEAVTITVKADEGYILPENIIVTGCDYIWNVHSGSLVLANPTANVFVTIVGVEGEGPDEPTETPTVNTYSISVNRKHVFNFASNVDQITDKGYVTLKYEPYTGYELPDNVTVSGCSHLWNANTGELVLMNPTGNVTVEITATEIYYNVYESLSGVTSNNSKVIYGSLMSGNVLFKYTAKSGYSLPKSITVTGADYTWASSTGTLTLYNFKGDVTIKINGVYNTPDPEPDPEPVTYTLKAGSYDFRPSTMGADSQAEANAKCLSILNSIGVQLPFTIDVYDEVVYCSDVSYKYGRLECIYYITFNSDGSIVFELINGESVTAYEDGEEGIDISMTVEYDFELVEDEYIVWNAIFEKCS